jgi:hypothetical protein
MLKGITVCISKCLGGILLNLTNEMKDMNKTAKYHALLTSVFKTMELQVFAKYIYT